MEQQMTIESKKDVTPQLRKALFPIALVAGALLIIWLILTIILGLCSTASTLSNLGKASRYFAIAPIILALPLAGLTIAIAIIQFTQLKQGVIKQKIMLGIVNILIGLVFLSFFFTCLTSVFNTDSWWHSSNLSGLGVMLYASIYCVLFCAFSDIKKYKLEKDNNILVKSIAISAISLIVLMLIPTIFAMIGGFIKIEQIEESNAAFKFRITALMTGDFILGVINMIAVSSFFMIPLVAFANNTKEIVKWSIIGGVSFAMVIVAFALWDGSNFVPASVFVLISWLCGLVAAFFLFKASKGIMQPKPIQQPVQPA